FKVPEQVAMATLYGTPMSRFITPQLTTMDTQLLDMGRQAAQMLLDQIDSPDMAPQHRFIDLRLKIRASTVKGSCFEPPFLVPWGTGRL
ncbi:MAG: substrate-binding domain-containing protein, partial [Muribaculaceae bacterium]|nr:substrate-binding domain-containing protein [Muribaculaceae bacterium]